MTTVAPDTIEDIDWDAEIPCAFVYCTDAAQWIIISDCPRCHSWKSVRYCGPCKDKLMAEVEAIGMAECRACDTIANFRDAFKVVPL